MFFNQGYDIFYVHTDIFQDTGVFILWPYCCREHCWTQKKKKKKKKKKKDFLS